MNKYTHEHIETQIYVHKHDKKQLLELVETWRDRNQVLTLL